jgi:hypothetical protein
MVPREVPKSKPAEHPETSGHTEKTTGGDHTTTEVLEFRSTNYGADSRKDNERAEPFVFCALPTQDAYEKIFRTTFTAAKESEMRQTEEVVRTLPNNEYEISNQFRRADLVTAITARRSKRPFLLVCHSEGSNENRDIPLGDGTITENEVRSICSQNDTELFLVSCRSKDLRIENDISYSEAFRIVKLATAGLSSTATVGQLKVALVEAAQRNLKRDMELRISYGADVKKVVIVTGASGDGDDGDDGPPCFTILIIAVGAFLALWVLSILAQRS